MDLPEGLEARKCSMCKNPMTYMGQSGYTRYWDCPNNCGPETEDLHPIIHCWVKECLTEFKRSETKQDPPYGNVCPKCGHSLRYHPQYGMGKPQDRQHSNKW